MRLPCNRFLLILLLIILSGCGVRNNLAPVAELRWQPFSKYQKTHSVRRGETLYAIAFRYDTDFRTLARLNRLRPPYSLRVGQLLKVRGSAPLSYTGNSVYSRRARQQKLRTTQKIIYSPKTNTPAYKGWLWPVSGRVATLFIPGQGKKGINIACKKGDKIKASASGIVAYAGSGIAGYGNLIIIKHNNQYLTAYGNNIRNLVSEGQRVNAGQVIAEAGIIDHRYWGVHFEIRKTGIPVNPLNYLQKG